MGKFEEPVPNKIEKSKSDGSEGKQNKLNGFGIAAKQLMDGNKNASSGDGSAVGKSADKSANSGVEIYHKDGIGDDLKVIAGPEILHKDGKGDGLNSIAGPEILHKDGKGDGLKSFAGPEILHKDGKGDGLKSIAGPEILYKDGKGDEPVSPDKNGIDAITAHPNGPEAGLKLQSEEFMKKFKQALELPPEKVPQALEVLYKDNQAQVKQVELRIASITKSLAEATFMPF